MSGNEQADTAAKSFYCQLSACHPHKKSTDLVPCPTKLISKKMATVMEQLRRKQVTGYRANCRWPSTGIIPVSSGWFNHQQIGHRGGEGVIRCQQYSIWLFVDNMWSYPGLNSGSPALPTIYISDFIIIIISIIMLQCCHEHRCITLSTRICAAEMAVRYAALSACRKVHPWR